MKKCREYDAAAVFGIEPFWDPVTQTYRFPGQVYGCLDTAYDLHQKGLAGKILLIGNRSLRQRYIKGNWHPEPECAMQKEYLVTKYGCPAGVMGEEDKSEDIASNNVYMVKKYVLNDGFGDGTRIESIAAIMPPAREARAHFFGNLVVRPHCKLDVITTDYPNTPAEFARQDMTLMIQEYGFSGIEPGDLGALEARFYDGEPYPHFQYLDRAQAYRENLVAV